MRVKSQSTNYVHTMNLNRKLIAFRTDARSTESADAQQTKATNLRKPTTGASLAQQILELDFDA